jgi:hypothetical protein
MGDDKRAKFYHALRASTAALLNYDLDNLTLTQSLKVDLASSLRLEIDRITAAQLAGEPVDLRELVLATESLSRLVAPDGTGTDVDFETRYQERLQTEFAGEREKLSHYLSARAERIAAYNAHHPDQARLKFERELQAEIDKYKDQIIPKPTIGWVRDGTHCFFSEGFDPNAEGRRHGFDGWVRGVDDASSALPDRVASSSPAPRAAARSENEPTATQSPQPPLPPNAAVPQHYLRGPDEPWRVYEGGRDRWSNRG